MKFALKKHHLFGALGLLAGFALGFLVWGQGNGAETPSAAVTQAAGTPVIIAESTGPASDANDIGSQLENLPRYDVAVADNDPVQGSADAPITIIEFADFQCPFCQRHFLETYPQLTAEYGDQIRFVYKDFPLTSIHPEAFPSALAAACAQDQGKFWEYHDLLYGGSLELGRAAYLAYAEQLSFDVTAFTTCMDDQLFSDQINEDAALAREIGVSATPTFFINGIALSGAQPYSVFAEIIDYELQNQTN